MLGLKREHLHTLVLRHHHTSIRVDTDAQRVHKLPITAVVEVGEKRSVGRKYSHGVVQFVAHKAIARAIEGDSHGQSEFGLAELAQEYAIDIKHLYAVIEAIRDEQFSIWTHCKARRIAKLAISSAFFAKTAHKLSISLENLNTVVPFVGYKH